PQTAATVRLRGRGQVRSYQRPVRWMDRGDRKLCPRSKPSPIRASGAKFAFANQQRRFVREGRKERERASCRAQLAALQSQFAADCEGAAEQARLYISRLWR